jgi:hypothetical protein
VEACLDFKLLNHGQTLMPEDLSNTSLKPVAALQPELPRQLRWEIVLMNQVVIP